MSYDRKNTRIISQKLESTIPSIVQKPVQFIKADPVILKAGRINKKNQLDKT